MNAQLRQTHEEAVKVGTVPDCEQALDGPLRFAVGTGAQKLVKVAVEAAHVVLRRVKITTRARWVSFSMCMAGPQFEEVVGDLEGEDARNAMVLAT